MSLSRCGILLLVAACIEVMKELGAVGGDALVEQLRATFRE